MRYFLLDKITFIDVGKEARGIKCVTLTDEVLHDHFPDYPVLPGALVTEAAAQLAGFLLEVTFNQGESGKVLRAVIAQIEKMKFYNTSGPGDRLELHVTIDSKLTEAARVNVSAVTTEGKKIASGSLIFAMLEISSERVTEQRLMLYKLWTRELSNCPQLR